MPTQGDETIDAFAHYYDRPYEIPKKEPFLKFVYNAEAKTVLNRTASSWGKYYIIVYMFANNQSKHHFVILNCE